MIVIYHLVNSVSDHYRRGVLIERIVCVCLCVREREGGRGKKKEGRVFSIFSSNNTTRYHVS